MTQTPCAACAAPIVLTEAQEKRLRESHETFYCPFGHGNWWAPPKPTPNEKTIKRLENERDAMREARDDLEGKLHETRRTARTCPLCDETFRARGHVAGHLLSRHAASMAALDRDDVDALEEHARTVQDRAETRRRALRT